MPPCRTNCLLMSGLVKLSLMRIWELSPLRISSRIFYPIDANFSTAIYSRYSAWAPTMMMLGYLVIFIEHVAGALFSASHISAMILLRRQYRRDVLGISMSLSRRPRVRIYFIYHDARKTDNGFINIATYIGTVPCEDDMSICQSAS